MNPKLPILLTILMLSCAVEAAQHSLGEFTVDKIEIGVVLDYQETRTSIQLVSSRVRGKPSIEQQRFNVRLMKSDGTFLSTTNTRTFSFLRSAHVHDFITYPFEQTAFADVTKVVVVVDGKWTNTFDLKGPKRNQKQ